MTCNVASSVWLLQGDCSTLAFLVWPLKWCIRFNVTTWVKVLECDYFGVMIVLLLVQSEYFSVIKPALQPNSRFQGSKVAIWLGKVPRLCWFPRFQLQVSRLIRLQILRVPRLNSRRLPGFWRSRFLKLNPQVLFWGPEEFLVEGGLLYIFTSSHPLFFTCIIFTSTPSHLLIFTSTHIIFSSSHLLIFSSSHLHIASSHLRIFSRSLPLSFSLFPHLFSLLRPRVVPTRRLEMQPFRMKWGSIGKKM